MFLRVADSRIDLCNPENCRAFKIVVEGANADLEQTRRLLAPIANLVDCATAWVSADALRGWPTLKDNQGWLDDLALMIEKARPHGWIDPATGAIRAHVEWSQADDNTGAIEVLPDGLKLAMRRWGSAVTIITSNENGVPHGITATAATSLTLDPPSLVICINRSASIHDPLLRTGLFRVNLLGVEHQPLCGDFSGKKVGQERFAAGRWSLSKIEPPRLIGAQASIFCKVEDKLVYGTHTLFVGRVTRVHVADEVKPLLYQNAAYGQFAAL